MIHSKEVKVVYRQNESDSTPEGFISQFDLYSAPLSYFTKIEVVDLFEQSDQETVGIVCERLRKGGVLIAKGVDFIDLCRKVSQGSVDLQKASAIVALLNRTHSILELKEFFQERNWKVLFAGLQDSKYHIEVQRT